MTISKSLHFTNDLMHFISASPTAYHVVSTIKKEISEHGFAELKEKSKWILQSGCGYFVERDQGGLIAFVLGQNETVTDGFRMLGCHTDSPSLHIKPQPLSSKNGYCSLGVELYGGSLLNTWFDRDLSIAGRVTLLSNVGQLHTMLIDFAKPLLTIPSLAIHFDRDANLNKSINAQKDIIPLLSLTSGDAVIDFTTMLEEQLHKEYPKLNVDKILSYDLFCYDFQSPSLLGLKGELLSASRLDNQLSCHSGLKAITNAPKNKNSMFLCYNHEENGSTSTSGAHSSFVDAIFDRIVSTNEDKYISLANSFFISMDNAHATHPNFPEKSDPQHQVLLGKGPVIKINAKNRYASNSTTSAVYKAIAQQAGVATQEFVMRNDMACGSTIGPTISAKLGVPTVDVGAPTLGMHSIREITGSSDPYELYKVSVEFLDSSIHRNIHE